MLEKEVAKLDGQMALLEQQRMMIESNFQDVSVFTALKTGSQAMDQMNKQLNIDELEEVKEKLEDQLAEMEEKREFFVRAGDVED